MKTSSGLGVESGPVTIEYKDTDGRNRTLRIEIDRQPPAISITSPVHDTSSDDHTPDYNGSIEDSDSGIVADSFRLVIDNDIDGANDGAKNDDFALDGKVPDARNIKGSDNTDASTVSHAGEYTGYTGYTDSANVVGVAWPDMMYDLGRESCADGPVCHIKADRHDDGSNTATFSDSIRLNLQDGNERAPTRDREYQVDFQAFAMDMCRQHWVLGLRSLEPALHQRPWRTCGRAHRTERVRLLLGAHHHVGREGS